MSLDYVKFTPGFGKFMPKEYRDMVDHGPLGKKTTVSQVGHYQVAANDRVVAFIGLTESCNIFSTKKNA